MRDLDLFLRRNAPHIQWEGSVSRQVGLDGDTIVAVWLDEADDISVRRGINGPTYGPSGVRVVGFEGIYRWYETLRLAGVLPPDAPRYPR